MSEDTTAQVTDPEDVTEDEEDVLAQAPQEPGKTVAAGSKIKLKPLKGDVTVDFTNSERETLKPRLSKDNKVFTNGFKIPGFSGYTDLPGKICVACGFRALKFSTQCSKCGGELQPE